MPATRRIRLCHRRGRFCRLRTGRTAERRFRRSRASARSRRLGLASTDPHPARGRTHLGLRPFRLGLRRPNRSPTSAAVASRQRAARSSAAPIPSTPWVISAAIAVTTIAGRSRGLSGWSYEEVLPYFKRAETWEDGETPYRGGDGPIYVRRTKDIDPLYEAYIEAGIRAGHPFTEDYNGAQTAWIWLGAMDDPRWPARQHRPRLSASGARTTQSHGPNRCAGASDRARKRPCGRRRVSPTRHRADRASHARGDSVRRIDQHAATADAVRHRRSRSSARVGDRGRRSATGGRSQPTGPLFERATPRTARAGAIRCGNAH